MVVPLPYFNGSRILKHGLLHHNIQTEIGRWFVHCLIQECQLTDIIRSMPK